MNAHKEAAWKVRMSAATAAQMGRSDVARFLYARAIEHDVRGDGDVGGVRQVVMVGNPLWPMSDDRVRGQLNLEQSVAVSNGYKSLTIVHGTAVMGVDQLIRDWVGTCKALSYAPDGRKLGAFPVQDISREHPIGDTVRNVIHHGIRPHAAVVFALGPDDRPAVDAAEKFGAHGIDVALKYLVRRRGGGDVLL